MKKFIEITFSIVSVVLIIRLIALIRRSIRFIFAELENRITGRLSIYQRGNNSKILLRLLLFIVIWFVLSNWVYR